MIRLWGRANSINVMKALWALDEVGAAYERVDAGMEHGVVDEDRYARLNPNRRVPTLEDGDLVLWESNAIVRYVAARYDAGGLWPEDPAARADSDRWMDWQQTTLHADLTYVFWAKVRNSPNHRDPERLASAERNLGELWSIVDARLADRPFLGGDRLTIGDIPLGCAMWRWANMDVAHPPLPNLEAWHERLQARPGFAAHVMLPLT